MESPTPMHEGPTSPSASARLNRDGLGLGGLANELGSRATG
jgi:hypothetical protein